MTDRESYGCVLAWGESTPRSVAAAGTSESDVAAGSTASPSEFTPLVRQPTPLRIWMQQQERSERL